MKDTTMADAPVHLAMPGRDGVAACGPWSKRTTGSARQVTCPKCRETWDFGLAEAKSGPRRVSEPEFAAEMRRRAREIAGQLNGSGLLPEGTRFEWK